jgi:hypothetical protein
MGGLLEFVRFEYLTKCGIDKFIEWSFEHFEDFKITIPVWRAITTRLSGTAQVALPNSSRYPKSSLPQSSPPTKPSEKTFRVREGFPLDGIIAELTRRHGGNVHERGIVDVSSSSVHSSASCFAAQNAVDLDQKNFFESNSEPNQWLSYDFKNRRIEVTDYSIAAHTNGLFLRSLVVEGSEDGSSWTVLDERKDNSAANSKHPISTFSVDRRLKCRYIRLRQTGKCAANHDYLILIGFEVFGSITE